MVLSLAALLRNTEAKSERVRDVTEVTQLLPGLKLAGKNYLSGRLTGYQHLRI